MTSSIQSGSYSITQTHSLCFDSLATFFSVSREKDQKINENQIKKSTKNQMNSELLK